MDHKYFALKKLGLFLVIILGIVLLTPHTAQANVRFDNNGQVPYYARIAQGEFYTDSDWVAIVFYRLPECIPADFNLLDFFDFANVWNCAPTTSGFEIWKNGPGIDTAPLQQELFGMGVVPVWFADTQELMTVIEDGVLTIDELGSLPSLKIGTASFYHETLHPWGGSVRNHLVFNAHGSLTDGTVFNIHAEHTETNFNVNINLNP
ncbi:MAG: hypothetical protein A2029_01275 [Chloroflexi bacterium RBG_19FT_COMBO_47_9]|nr:MAG: hypothetical protein A2029_01275 [Chloroflexi bacterium RBG_19FT_COMBO_47_9]